jgi:hypothetical protein
LTPVLLSVSKPWLDSNLEIRIIRESARVTVSNLTILVVRALAKIGVIDHMYKSLLIGYTHDALCLDIYCRKGLRNLSEGDDIFMLCICRT